MTYPTDIHKDSKIKVVAAIPCFNTELYIGGIVSEAQKYVDTVIVIDDGSNDETAKLANDAGAIVIKHLTNRGYGGAIISCFEAAKANNANILVVLDGDGQHKPEEIPHLIKPIINGEADMTIGSRFCVTEVTVPRYRQVGIKIITWLFNFGCKIKVTDSQSGFRAYKNNIYRGFNLVEKGMSISIETLEATRRSKAVIKEVPVSCTYPPSNINLHEIKHGLSVALGVIRIRFRQNEYLGVTSEYPVCE